MGRKTTTVFFYCYAILLWMDQKASWESWSQNYTGRTFQLSENEVFDAIPDNVDNVYSWTCYRVKKVLEARGNDNPTKRKL
jgi:hypothetical protein